MIFVFLFLTYFTLYDNLSFQSVLPFPLGDLPDPGIEPVSLKSPTLVGGFFTTKTTWKALLFPFIGLLSYIWGFPWWPGGQRVCLQCRRHRRYGFNPWVRNILWRRKWQPIPVFLQEKSHGQSSRRGYSPESQRVCIYWEREKDFFSIY